MKKLWYCLCAFCFLPTIANSAISVEELRAVLEEHPDIVVNALQKYEEKRHEIEAIKMDALSTMHLDELNSDKGLPYVGPKNAKVTIVEFFDFSCGYCREISPVVKQIIENNPDVKVVFKPLTFVSDISKYEAEVAFVAHKHGKFMEYYTNIMNTKVKTKNDVNNIALKVGLYKSDIEKGIKAGNFDKTLKEVSKLTETLNIHGVPTLFINGSRINTMDYFVIQEEIDKAK